MENQNQQPNITTPTAVPAVNERKIPKKALIAVGSLILLIIIVVVLQGKKSSQNTTTLTQNQPISANTATEIPSVTSSAGINTLSPTPIQINNAKDLNNAMTNVKNLDPNSINTAVSENGQLSSGFQ